MNLNRILKGEWRAFFSDKSVEKRYVTAGANFGDAVSYSGMGSVVGFEDMLNSWAGWEKEYSIRGYRTISLESFIDFGGYGVKIDHLLGKKRAEKEQPKLHAQTYTAKYPQEPTPVINLEKMMKDRQPQAGAYQLPSTEE